VCRLIHVRVATSQRPDFVWPGVVDGALVCGGSSRPAFKSLWINKEHIILVYITVVESSFWSDIGSVSRNMPCNNNNKGTHNKLGPPK
jgi:hypothetical protein